MVKPKKVKLECNCIFCMCFRTVSGYIAQASLELTIFMLWLCESWDSESGSFGTAPCCLRGPQGPMPAIWRLLGCASYISIHKPQTCSSSKPGPFLLGRKSLVLPDRSQGSGDSKPWLKACCGWILRRRQTSAQTRLCSWQKFMAGPLGGFPNQHEGRFCHRAPVDKNTDDLRGASDPS